MDPKDSRIGAYRIEGRLGEGGMGEVYLAWDERLGRHVALKRIRADLPVEERHRARFRREARSAARLSHPAIVQVFDLLESEEGDCLVMERVEGWSLAEAIHRGEVDVELALRLAAEIADGLAEAHGKGLVHRDLKPENVMVTTSGHAKILDFGLARMLWSEPSEAGSGGASAALTQAGALVGTVHAMSPEQASGRPVDHRGDLFALGGLLYEMLAGRAPFRGENLLDTLRRVTSEEPEPLERLRPDLPAELIRLVARLLAKAPEDRPPNARVVADALERLRGSGRLETGEDAGSRGSEEPLATPGRAAPGRATPGRDAAPAGAAGELADLPTGEWPTAERAAASPAPVSATPETAVRTLLLVELCDRDELYRRHGEAPAAEALIRCDRRLRELVQENAGLAAGTGETYVALFERPVDAVAGALAFQRVLAELAGGLGIGVRARAAVHLGEVLLRRHPPEEVSRGAPALEAEGSARTAALRLLALAGPGQTLVTAGAFDLARRAASSGSLDGTSGVGDGGTRWLAHGRYLVEGVDEPFEVFEVGGDGLAPLAAPPDSPSARRVPSPSEERMLGWRPAVGQAIPRRDRWILEERVGEGGFGEVWRARHKSGERRVFKFCFEADRLRALKREVTLFRLLKETLGHRDDIARILDWHFDDAPYFVESEYTEGGNLAEWAADQGGLDAVPLELRLGLVAEVAEALGAAHSVGVLHKDVKPENVLVTHDRGGRPRARLTDFGIGLLTERERLLEPGFTALGFTRTVTPPEGSGAGTLGYLAPELVEGKAATVQADVYSLGVLLYQSVAGDFTRTLAPGWERDVPDEILAEDVGRCVDGRPERRPASALEVAERLRTLAARRRARAEEKARRRAFERSQRRRRLATVVASVALVVLAIVAVMAGREGRARRTADERRAQAERLVGFMLGDLQNKLHALGRLDLLDAIGEQAMEYFAAVEPEELSADELLQRNEALNQLGLVRFSEGDLEGALATYGQALDLARSLAAREPGNVAWQLRLGAGHFYLGRILWQQGKHEEAASRFRAQCDAAQAQRELHPEDTEVLSELANARNNLGFVEQAGGELKAAGESFSYSLGVFEDLLEQRPDDADLLRQVSDQAMVLGRLYWRVGEAGAARTAYEKGLRLARRLVAGDSQDTLRLEHLAIVHNILGRALLAAGDLRGADQHLAANVEILEGLVAIEPQQVTWQRELGFGHAATGRLRLLEGDAEAALDPGRRGLEILTRLAATEPSAETAVADAHLTLGEILASRNDREGSRRQAAEALARLEPPAEGRPGVPRIRRRLARGLLLAGRVAEDPRAAEDAWRRAVSLLEPMLAEGAIDLESLSLLEKLYELLGRRKEAGELRRRREASIRDLVEAAPVPSVEEVFSDAAPG